MNNRIYIAGKITGDDDYRAKFKLAESEIKKARHQCSDKTLCKNCVFHNSRYIYGCVAKDLITHHESIEPVNPADFNLEGKPYWLAMLKCFIKLSQCSYVYMLRDWKESKGARKEHRLAKWFHKKIIYQK